MTTLRSHRTALLYISQIPIDIISLRVVYPLYKLLRTVLPPVRAARPTLASQQSTPERHPIEEVS